MKYYGVVHGRTSGYNNEVRKLLGQLKAFLDATNQKFGVRKKLLEDGAEVRVSIIMNGAVPIYKAIVIPADTLAGELSLDVFMESGFIDGIRGTLFEASVYYTTELAADLPAWLDWLHLDLTSTARVYTPGMMSLGIPNTAKLSDFAGLFNYSAQSGKALLLWQALAGTESVRLSNYAGDVVSS